MVFELTQEQQLLRETARDFSEKEIFSLGAKIDSERRVPPDLLAKLSLLGLLGVTVPGKYGGAGADFLSQVIVSEEVSRASGSLGFQVAFHNALLCDALVASSNDTLKELLLPKLVGGCGAPDLSAALVTDLDNVDKGITCEINGGKIRINGSSENVPSASEATVFLIVASLANSKEKVAVAFSKDDLRSQANSLSVGPPKRLLGMRAAGAASVSFKGLELPTDRLLYEPPKARSAIENELLPRSRLAMASVALGIAQAAIDASATYANQRMQFNKKIGSFYAVKDMIATSETELQTARYLTYHAASRVEPGASSDPSVARDSAIAKISASLAAVNSARRAIRVHGGYGFMRDYPVERYARDARLTPVFPETNEELKSFLASSMLGN